MGLIIGFVTRRMDKLETNPFFSTIAAAFAMAVPAYLAAAWQRPQPWTLKRITKPVQATAMAMA